MGKNTQDDMQIRDVLKSKNSELPHAGPAEKFDQEMSTSQAKTNSSGKMRVTGHASRHV